MPHPLGITKSTFPRFFWNITSNSGACQPRDVIWNEESLKIMLRLICLPHSPPEHAKSTKAFQNVPPWFHHCFIFPHESPAIPQAAIRNFRRVTADALPVIYWFSLDPISTLSPTPNSLRNSHLTREMLKIHRFSAANFSQIDLFCQLFPCWHSVNTIIKNGPPRAPLPAFPWEKWGFEEIHSTTLQYFTTTSTKEYLRHNKPI